MQNNKRFTQHLCVTFGNFLMFFPILYTFHNPPLYHGAYYRSCFFAKSACTQMPSFGFPAPKCKSVYSPPTLHLHMYLSPGYKSVVSAKKGKNPEYVFSHERVAHEIILQVAVSPVAAPRGAPEICFVPPSEIFQSTLILHF